MTTTKRETLLGSSTYFSYLPPVRLLRLEASIYRPKFLIPITSEGIADLTELAAMLKSEMSHLRIGLDLDFHPPLLQASDNLDTVRDFINQAAATNFYGQISNSNDERAFNVSFVADPTASRKRALTHSKFVIPSKFLYPPAKIYYKITAVECMRFIDLEEHHINEAGLTYAPHNLIKGKLNSRFVDSIQSIYRDTKFKAKADGLVAVLTVERVKQTPEMIHDILTEMEHAPRPFHIMDLLNMHVKSQICKNLDLEAATAEV